MTTNQTIDGVRRSTLDRALNGCGLEKTEAMKELRALLDATETGVCRGCFTEQPTGQACKTCAEVKAKPAAQPQGVSSDVIAFGIRVEKLLCKALGREWSASGISIESLVAQIPAKVQGETVAWMFRWDYDHGNGWCRNAVRFVESMEHVEHEDKSTWRDITPLYAEQPAPAAAVPISYGALDPVERLAVCRGDVVSVSGSTCNQIREEAGQPINRPCKACGGGACIDR